jgi:hypothetical protein
MPRTPPHDPSKILVRFATETDPETGEENGWVELHTGDWCTAWHIEAGGAVSEMRVYPASAQPDAIGGPIQDCFEVPKGGISAQLMRTFSPSLGRQLLAHPRRNAARPSTGRARVGGIETSGGGRGVHTPEALLAQVAVLYEDAVIRGERAPARYVAAQLRQEGLDRADATVRALIHRARRRGFLTQTHARRAHGAATKKAHEVLRRQDNNQGGSES